MTNEEMLRSALDACSKARQLAEGKLALALKQRDAARAELEQFRTSGRCR